MIGDKLKKSILKCAFNGELTKMESNDSNIEQYLFELRKYEKIKRKDLDDKFEPLYEIPDNWRWVQLGDITGIYGGKRIPAGRKLSDVDTGYKYIRVADMNDFTVELDNIKYVPEDIFPQIKNYIINKEDLYITVAGTIGKIGYIPEELDGANLTENANKIVFNNLNKMWLFYVLKSPVVQQQIEDMITRVGQPKLAIKRIVNILIPLPPIEEQQRIVEKIEELFVKIDDIYPLEEELEKLKLNLPIDMKYSLLDSAIKGNLSLNNIKELPVINDNNYDYEGVFTIPNNWRWVKIDDVIDIQTGLSFKKTEQCNNIINSLRILRGGNINNNYQYLLKDDDIYVNYTDKYIKLIEGDVITPSVTSMEQMGKTGYIDKELDKITAGGFVYIMRTKNKNILLPKYMMYFINSKFHKNMCKPNIHKSGQAFYNLKKSGLVLQPIPLPPIEEQQRIVDKLEQLLPLCNDIENLIKSE